SIPVASHVPDSQRAHQADGRLAEHGRHRADRGGRVRAAGGVALWHIHSAGRRILFGRARADLFGGGRRLTSVGVGNPREIAPMIDAFGIFAFVWPFVSIGLMVAFVFAV